MTPQKASLTDTAMKARFRFLLEHSINWALAAIEVYNKPTFKEREQVFAILLTAAWESLLKAKVLRDNRNRLASLYVRAGARYKKTRTGRYLTIDVLTAARKCSLNTVALENLDRLVDIRDAAIHLTAQSPSLAYVVYSLGLAALRNYAKLLQDWFAVTLAEYDFFILPLGFKYPFRAVTTTQLRREPKEVAAILRQVAKAQSEGRDVDQDFHLAFEITTTLVSARKVAGTPDVTAAIDPTAKGAVVVEKRVRLVDQDPPSFTDLWRRVHAAVPNVKQPLVFKVLKRPEDEK